MVRLGLVGGGWLLGPGGLRESTDHSDLTFFCGWGSPSNILNISYWLAPNTCSEEMGWGCMACQLCWFLSCQWWRRPSWCRLGSRGSTSPSRGPTPRLLSTSLLSFTQVFLNQNITIKIGAKNIKVNDVSFRDIRSWRDGQTSPLGNEQNA